MLVFFLVVLLLLSVTGNVFLGLVCIKFGKTILTMENSVDDVLTKLDSEYREIGKILATPLASDDPYVLRVQKAIKRAQNSVFESAVVLSENWKSKNVQEKDTEKDRR